MRVRRRLPAGAIAVVVALGLITATVGACTDPKTSQVNPDDTLTDAEVDREHEAGEQDYQNRFAQWLLEFEAGPVDLRLLPRAPIMVTEEEGSPTLGSALQAADIVVLGEGRSVSFRADGTAWVVIQPARVLKGTPATTYEVEHMGGPEPWPDWDSPTLGFAEGSPWLLPGDRAVLFLEKDTSRGVLNVQSWSGTYAVSPAGIVHALEGNVFGSPFDGMTVDEFLAEVDLTLQ